MSKTRAKTVSDGSNRPQLRAKPEKPGSQRRKEAAAETSPEFEPPPGHEPVAEAARAEVFQTMRRNIAEGVAAADKTPPVTQVELPAAQPKPRETADGPADLPPARKAEAPAVPRTPVTLVRPTSEWSAEDIFEPAANLVRPKPSLNPNPSLASGSWTPRAPVPRTSGAAENAAAVRTRPSVDTGATPASGADRDKGRITAMSNSGPAVGYRPPPAARPTASAPLPRRPGDPLWADAWRELPAVEQTLARLTEALSRDQRTANAPRVSPASVDRRERTRGLRVSHVAAVSCVGLLAALSGLALAYGWPSDAPGISALLRAAVPAASSPESSMVPPEPTAVMPSAPADNIAGEAEEYVVSTAPAGETQRAAAKRGKTVATTKLVVANASGEALHYIPLSISTSSTSGADKPAIRLSGLPTETVLTSGEDLGNGAWLLKPGDEQDLKLAVQSNAPREILIGVEAFEMKTGELAAPPQDLRVQVLPPKQLLVQPAADTIKPAIEPVAEPSEVEPPTAAKSFLLRSFPPCRASTTAPRSRR